MPSYIYRFKNLAIMFVLMVCISIASIYVPIIVHNLGIFIPNQQSIKLGQALFSPIASSTGLLIGFLLNQAQANHREVESIVSLEASRVNNLDRILLRFGSDQALAIRVKLKAYIQSIIGDEWLQLQDGKGSEKTHMLWRSISQEVFRLDPETPKQLTLYGDVIKKSEEVAESRELRIDRSNKCLPTLFWIVIFLCLSMLVGVNTLFLSDEHFTLGLTILPITFGALISLLVITDRPFKGEDGIEPAALEKVLASIETRTF